MPKSAARAETPAWLPELWLALVVSPQGPQTGRGGCPATGSMLLLSLELAAVFCAPPASESPRNPLGRTPHLEQPSLATNDSLDSQGWLAAGKGWARRGSAINPPPPTLARGQRSPAHGSFPYRFSRSAPEAKETWPQAIHYRLVQGERASAGTAQLGAFALSLICSSSCEQRQVLSPPSA